MHPSEAPDLPMPVEERIECLEVWGGNRGLERHFRLPGLEVWLYSRPYEDAASGGDVYYLSSCASGRISRLMLADVSGHGEAVSNCAGRLRDLMRRHINRISQSGFVADINKDFTELGEGNFATAFIGTFFATTRSLQLCSAGHPQPLLYREKTGDWEMVDPVRDHSPMLIDLPLGITEGVEYGQSRYTLSPGDMLLAYTDGLVEMRLADDTLLKTSGLLSLARSLEGTAPCDFMSRLANSVCGSESSPIEDDVTMLLIRADGSGTKLRNSLLAPFRFLFGGRNKMMLRDS